MRKFVVIGVVIAAVASAAAYFGVFPSKQTTTGQGGAQAGGPGNGSTGSAAGRGGPGAPGGAGRAGQGTPGGGGFGGGGFGGFGGGGGPRAPLTVEMAGVKKGDIAARLTVVGNLIGEQTVDVAPKTGGRLISVSVQLGDRVRRNQIVAKIEDREIVSQVRQQESSLDVSKATIRQREADMKVAEVNFDRSKNLYGRQLLSKQALDDAESRYLSAEAQIDLSKAQQGQTEARLEELRINLQNTSVVSPVDGFVAKRHVDPGAMVSQNAPVLSVVDISRLRLVTNVVEKDLRMVSTGDPALVEVDAYPGDKFHGRIARVSPVLDPATRTASMEVEIPNADNKLKPGMYARVALTVEEHKDAVVAPRSSIVDLNDKRGVWMPNEENKARFQVVELGIEDGDLVEIKSGLKEGDRIVTTGATAVRNGDQLVIGGPGGPGGGRGGRGNGGAPGAPGGERGGPQGQRPPQ